MDKIISYVRWTGVQVHAKTEGDMNPYQEALQYTVQKGTEAQKRIRDTLLTMMEQMPLDQVEVKELCVSSHTARSTFYLYYRNTDDVLHEMESRLVQDLTDIATRKAEVSSQGRPASSQTQTEEESQALISQIWTALSEHRRLIQIQVLNNSNYDFMKKVDLGLKYSLWEYLFGSTGSASSETEFLVPMVSICIFRGWIHEQTAESDRKTSPSAPKEMVSVLLEEARNRVLRNTRQCRVLKTGMPSNQ